MIKDLVITAVGNYDPKSTRKARERDEGIHQRKTARLLPAVFSERPGAGGHLRGSRRNRQRLGGEPPARGPNGRGDSIQREPGQPAG